jgi:hypothetical protein
VRLRILTTLLLVGAAWPVAGCGSDEAPAPSIPASSAQELDARLAEVQRRFDVGGGACDDITNDSQPAVESILSSLPSSVDGDVRSALEGSFDRLFELTAEQCKGDEQPTTTETVPETTTETVPTETTPTETTPTETTPTETTPTETTPPTDTAPTAPEGDQGNGGGAGPGDQG